MPQEKFDEQRVAVQQGLVSNPTPPHDLHDLYFVQLAWTNREAIATGILRNWVSTDQPSVLSVLLAGGLLGQDGSECAATKDFDNAAMGKLKAAAAAKVIPATTPQK